MLPVLFKIGSFPVHAWGLLLMAGFLLATWRAAKFAPRYGIKPEDMWDAALLGLFGGVVGARLAFVLLNVPYFSAHPGEIFAIWTGGMTFYGGLIGGLGTGLMVAKLRKMNVWDAADLAAVSFPIGYALGRIGCLLNGCCYGGVCDFPWAVRFDRHDGTFTPPSHPAQLYSALISVAMYFVLAAVERQRKFRGQVVLAYGALYGVYRFVIEFVREGATADLSGLGGLTQGQVASLVLSLAALAVYAALVRRQPRPAPVA